jgi:hypothetical protein
MKAMVWGVGAGWFWHCHSPSLDLLVADDGLDDSDEPRDQGSFSEFRFHASGVKLAKLQCSGRPKPSPGRLHFCRIIGLRTEPRPFDALLGWKDSRAGRTSFISGVKPAHRASAFPELRVQSLHRALGHFHGLKVNLGSCRFYRMSVIECYVNNGFRENQLGSDAEVRSEFSANLKSFTPSWLRSR